MHAINPDLSAFKRRGGKLLIYHGWSDGGSGGAISPLNTLNYLSSVYARMGPKTGRLAAAVHGAGDGALRRRFWAESVQCARGAGAMAGVGHRAGSHHGFPSDEQSCGNDAAAVPLSSDGNV
jgi:tannase/feruloyl esterase